MNRFKRGWGEALSRHQTGIRTFSEAMFSLNIAYAAGHTFSAYVSRSQLSWVPRSDLGYYVRRSAVRIDDLLHVPSTAAVSTNAVARPGFPVHRIGLELTFIITIACIAIVIFLLLRLSRGTSLYRVTTERVAGGTALFLLPTCYSLLSALTWRWGIFPEEYAIPFWPIGPTGILTVEVVIFGVVVAVGRYLRAGLVMSFLIAHYVLWIFVLLPDIPVSVYPLTARHALLSIFPLSGIAWLLYIKARPESLEANPGLEWTWIAAGGALATVLLLALWLPAPQYSLAASRDMDSLTIHMSRGPCRGLCSQYTVTIHGNGTVEYEGTEFVKTKGRQIDKISHEQLLQVLQNLDHVGFTSLEDRAFDWCFDTSSVGVWVSADGRTKRVVSDGNCVGAKSSPQERFVQAAGDIDVALGSDRWVLCDGHPCHR